MADTDDFNRDPGEGVPPVDPTSISARLLSLLPPWFPSVTESLRGLLAGVGSGHIFGLQIIEFTRQQTRISTATGPWLDIAAWDFLGERLKRWFAESNASFAFRVKQEIIRPRSTRLAIVIAVRNLVGAEPKLWEAWNPGDCGAYDTGSAGYDVAGRWGSYDINQIFVQVPRPIGQGIPLVSGYDQGGGGYDAGAIEYTDPLMTTGAIRDQDIYATVAATIAAGTIAWVQIGTETPPRYDDEYIPTLDYSRPRNSVLLGV